MIDRQLRQQLCTRIDTQRIIDDPTSGLRVDGYFDDRDPERLHDMPAQLGGPLGRLDDLLELSRSGQVDIVYITLPLRAESRISEMVRKLADTTASVWSDLSSSERIAE